MTESQSGVLFIEEKTYWCSENITIADIIIIRCWLLT